MAPDSMDPAATKEPSTPIEAFRALEAPGSTPGASEAVRAHAEAAWRDVAAESAGAIPGDGATAHGARSGSASHAVRALGTASSLRVLVVVADMRAALRLRALLEHWMPAGYRLTRAATLADALRRVASLEPHAVLLDPRLPDAPPGQAIAALRRAVPSLPIVLVRGREPAPLGVDVAAADPSASSLTAAALARALRRAVERRAKVAVTVPPRAEGRDDDVEALARAASEGIAVLDGCGAVVWHDAKAAAIFGGDIEGMRRALAAARITVGCRFEMTIERGGERALLLVRASAGRFGGRRARFVWLESTAGGGDRRPETPS